tara:strand:+ start:1192 stop:1317 length:126 start_codon:yes stop_codon:yes gene_type:complete
MVKSVTKKDKETGIGMKNTPTFEKGAHTRQFRISALKELKE